MVGSERAWTFLSNHGHVLVLVAREPGILLSELSQRVGITERAARSILRDLEGAGYLSRSRVGRRNRYEVHADGPLRHPEESTALVSDLLQIFPR
ncbi:helix-turn-helix transcriptional regulator [Cellulomonas phragmiteti]|uniref:helix-turn-helix transcriptional regulator n=1 Tax=Cellulomonas phragmiteti TaxID=478780 RepID=UPI001EF2F85F|nr:winged helix-turn-helix transcriptional regulator [Cellulomonas phragmiteti]